MILPEHYSKALEIFYIARVLNLKLPENLLLCKAEIDERFSEIHKNKPEIFTEFFDYINTIKP